ncbi:MAG: hypothetical protein J7453_10030, partial [Thermomicrobium sp.]|nr:hypothetical protein [Thermomicrobium sp.]
MPLARSSPECGQPLRRWPAARWGSERVHPVAGTTLAVTPWRSVRVYDRNGSPSFPPVAHEESVLFLGAADHRRPDRRPVS